MNILQELENYINEFNQDNNENNSIDTIRIDFSKQHKKKSLEQLGRWKKINKNDKRIMDKLKRRLSVDEVTSAYQLENHNIYYYNSNRDKPRYRIATMVIFGLKQYHKAPPPAEIINSILNIMQSSVKRGRNLLNIDICYDIKAIPNIEALKKFYYLTDYKKQGNTFYINSTNILSMDRICIYNKALKNGLDGILWRIEATISIPNYNYLALPINEFIEIISLAKTNKSFQRVEDGR